MLKWFALAVAFQVLATELGIVLAKQPGANGIVHALAWSIDIVWICAILGSLIWLRGEQRGSRTSINPTE